MDRRDPDNPELDDFAPHDIENSEIVEGDESDLVLVDDFDIPVNGDLVIEHEPELTSAPADFSSEHTDEENIEEVYAEVRDEVVQEPLADVPDAVEIVSDTQEQEPIILQTPPSTLQRVRRMFLSSPADLSARLESLTQAIEVAPESAANYVLRGEMYMDLREYALAHADFQCAYEMAEAHFEIADWGFMEQAMRDRALAGLEKVQRRL